MANWVVNHPGPSPMIRYMCNKIISTNWWVYHGLYIHRNYYTYIYIYTACNMYIYNVVVQLISVYSSKISQIFAMNQDPVGLWLGQPCSNWCWQTLFSQTLIQFQHTRYNVSYIYIRVYTYIYKYIIHFYTYIYIYV